MQNRWSSCDACIFNVFILCPILYIAEKSFNKGAFIIVNTSKLGNPSRPFKLVNLEEESIVISLNDPFFKLVKSEKEKEVKTIFCNLYNELILSVFKWASP